MRRKCELAAMDETGHTNDYANHYYAKIRGKCRKSYIKKYIVIDVDIRMILNYAVNRGPKYDIQFAIGEDFMCICLFRFLHRFL